MRTIHSLHLVMLTAGVVAGTPAAHAGVIVNILPSDQTVNIGETFTVDIVASMSEPVLGWGMVFSIQNPEIVSINGTPAAASPWFDTTQPYFDGWLLGGLAFPEPISGADILLATLSFTATAFGESDLELSINPESLRQGFALGPPWPTGTMDFVQINFGHVNVIPTPGALILMAVGTFATIRRRRA